MLPELYKAAIYEGLESFPSALIQLSETGFVMNMLLSEMKHLFKQAIERSVFG